MAKSHKKTTSIESAHVRLRAGRERPTAAAESRSSRRREEREQLRALLGYEDIRPTGEKIVRAKWDDARCVGWAIKAFAPGRGYTVDVHRALQRIREAAEESPYAVTAKARTAISESERVLGPGYCKGMHRCFQLRARAALDAAQNLPALGYPPSTGLVDAYVMNIGTWQSLIPSQADLDEVADLAQKAAPPEALAALPQRSMDPGHNITRELCLSPKHYEQWKFGVELVTQVQIMHDRALEYRDEALRLGREQLPSASIFRSHLEGRLRALYTEQGESSRKQELQREMAFSIVLLEELLRGSPSSNLLARAKTLRSHLESLKTLLCEIDWETQHETKLYLQLTYTLAGLNGLLHRPKSRKRFSVAHVRGFMEGLLTGLSMTPDQTHRERLERVIGASAADSSQWRLAAVRWRLQQADFLLEPLGSYLSEWRPPKQLQVRYALDSGLRQLLGDVFTNYKKSKAIAAAFRIYAESALGPSGSIKESAANTIEKLRARIDLVRATEMMEHLRRWSVS